MQTLQDTVTICTLIADMNHSVTLLFGGALKSDTCISTSPSGFFLMILFLVVHKDKSLTVTPVRDSSITAAHRCGYAAQVHTRVTVTLF